MSTRDFLKLNIFYPASNSSVATNFVQRPSSLDDNSSLKEIRLALIKGKWLEPSKAGCPFCTPKGIQVPDDVSLSIYRELSGENGDQATNGNNFCDIYIKDHEREKLDDYSNSLEQLLSLLNLNKVDEYSELVRSATLAVLKSPATCNSGNNASDNNFIVSNMSEGDWQVVLHQSSFLNGYRIPSFIVPRFIVTDNAYLDVFETQSGLSASMTRNAFSKNEVEASIGGGAFGYAAALSTSFALSQTDTFLRSINQSKKAINITYNLPRVKLFLTSDDLELSSECKEELQSIKSAEESEKPQALTQFRNKFGHIFATRVELGGRLHCAEDISALGTQEAVAVTKAFEASAMASINGSFAQASGGVRHTRETSATEDTQANYSQKSVIWQAQGGNTLLCNNPAAWSPTVSPFQNWRQEGVLHLPDIISKIEDNGNVATDFNSIAERTRKTSQIPLRLRVMNAKLERNFFLTFAQMGHGYGKKNSTEYWQILPLKPPNKSST
ncbi:hypothetical protein N7530_006166 [Penicillium desertorum]|uniref:MACPF-like domain-containing protein n=1 Tax=Penicillium desertorum TaxID=1303715 RepID=A0A9W9WR57_9EURO|nr:hypothetical protein N7530_006166 [Penicillium desertorum]